MATISGSLSHKLATHSLKQAAKRSPSSALTMSLSVSWLGMPSAKDRKRRKNPWLTMPQRRISTKSSAPARVPHSTKSRTSGKG